MPDETDPPRKVYALKPRSFEAINELPKQPGSTAQSPLHGPSGGPPDRIDVRDIYRQASPVGSILGKNAGPADRNEVHAILDENHQRANAAGLNDIAARPARKSRRKRDYWLLLTCDCLFFGAVIAYTGPHNAVPFTYALGGMIFSVIGLTWIMWFVMDNY